VNTIFLAKVEKSKKNIHIIETTASILMKFRTTIKTTRCSSWVTKYAQSKFKMADSRHIENIDKSPYFGNGLTDRHEVGPLTLSNLPAGR